MLGKLFGAEADAQFAREVFDHLVWQDTDGAWHEEMYEPWLDGYMTTRRRLMSYTSTVEGALEIREEVFRRTGVAMQAHPTDPAAVAAEAYALNGAARWRPSAAMLNELAQSRWEVLDECTYPLLTVLTPEWPDARAGHIYIVRSELMADPLVLYVGQTTRGVAHRLRQHIKQESAIGQRLRRAIENREPITVEVISIKAAGYNGLNTAEEHYIKTYKPGYNIALTKDETP